MVFLGLVFMLFYKNLNPTNTCLLTRWWFWLRFGATWWKRIMLLAQIQLKCHQRANFVPEFSKQISGDRTVFLKSLWNQRKMEKLVTSRKKNGSNWCLSNLWAHTVDWQIVMWWMTNRIYVQESNALGIKGPRKLSVAIPKLKSDWEQCHPGTHRISVLKYLYTIVSHA